MTLSKKIEFLNEKCKKSLKIFYFASGWELGSYIPGSFFAPGSPFYEHNKGFLKNTDLIKLIDEGIKLIKEHELNREKL